ncbi:MAG: AAA family ATPase, partial [Candidatus Dormibacteraeota bacterium]|nr:AAA family ATPase [Candidatus Dormibacteraeota bacterium]
MPELLEREEELASIDEALRLAHDGAGQALAILGPAGIGKTVLLGRAREMGCARGFVVLAARPGELERELGWGVVLDLFARRVHTLSPRSRSDVLSGPAARVASLMGESDDGPAVPSDATAELLHALYWLTSNLASEAPILLAVDDAHWADTPSQRLLAYLARRIDDLPVALIITARSPEAREERNLVGLIRKGNVDVLQPRALSERATESLLCEAWKRDVDDAFAGAAHRATKGNPFLLHAAVSALMADGVAPTAANAERVAALQPQSVSRAALLRLTGLPSGAANLALAVSVLGTSAQLHVATRLADLDDATASRAADALIAADILTAGTEVDFVHPLVRSAIYADIPPLEKAEWHRRAAQLLEEAGAADDLVVKHLLLTQPRADAHVVARLRAAAASALQRGSPDAAVMYLRRALTEGPGECRGDVLFELGSAEGVLEDPDATDHLREARGLVTDQVREGKVAVALVRTLILSQRFEEASDVTDEVLPRLRTTDSELALQLDAERIAAMMTTANLFLEGARRLADLSRDLPGATRGERLMLLNLATVAYVMGEPASAINALVAR